MKARLGHSGFSLVELLIVIAIIAILLGIAVLAFSNWVTKYTIEAQIQELYGDLMLARTRANDRNRIHFVAIGTGNYTIIDDTNEDGLNASPPDTVTMAKPFKRPITNPPAAFTFDRRGMAIAAVVPTVCVFSTVSPDYDCLVVDQTRISMGKIINQGGGCDANNCGAK